MMRAVEGREDYLRLRGSAQQEATVRQVRQGNGNAKLRLLQCNYSCMPNADGTLKGSTTMSTTVGMDVDHIAPKDMAATRDRILAKRDELGLLMLELSARGEGFHLVFRRREGLSQEDNLHWASDLLGGGFRHGGQGSHAGVFYHYGQRRRLAVFGRCPVCERGRPGVAARRCPAAAHTRTSDAHGSGRA